MNYCCDYGVVKIDCVRVDFFFFFLQILFVFVLETKRYNVNLDITRLPTFLVEVDNSAVRLAPGAQEDGSSFGDVRLTGVGFWSANQNTDAE